MSALADCLRALRPFAHPSYHGHEVARDVLRKHAPCGRCAGTGGYTAAFPPRCGACLGEGWTPASIEAAIAREDERARLAAAAIDAAREAFRVDRVTEPFCEAMARLIGFEETDHTPTGAPKEPTGLDAVVEAAKDVVLVRDALDKRRKAEPNPDNREPSVPFEVDAAIDYLADVLADNASDSEAAASKPTCSACDGEGVVEVDTCALCDQGICRTCPQCGEA